eukprot:1215912-Rhodomonas_salina.2
MGRTRAFVLPLRQPHVPVLPQAREDAQAQARPGIERHHSRGDSTVSAQCAWPSGVGPSADST